MKVYSDSLSRCIRMALLIVVMLVPALAIDPLGLDSRIGLTTPVSAQDGTGWSGGWNGWGGVYITVQTTNYLRGDYSYGANHTASTWTSAFPIGAFKGTFSGNQFTGTWGEEPDRNGLDTSGEIELTLATDGKSITGRYRTARAIREGGGGWIPIYPSWTHMEDGTDTGTPTGTGVALVAESRTADPGSTVRLPIRLDRAVNVGSMDFTLTYDAQVLKVNTYDDGAQVSGVSYVTNIEIIPQVNFAMATPNGISGSGSVIYIEFQVIGAAGTSSPLTFSKVDIKDISSNKVTVSITNGTVTVASATGPGGKLKGDYNGDGKVTELDALAALKMSAKSLKPVDLILDMNGDDAVKAEDALAILKIAVGK